MKVLIHLIPILVLLSIAFVGRAEEVSGQAASYFDPDPTRESRHGPVYVEISSEQVLGRNSIFARMVNNADRPVCFPSVDMAIERPGFVLFDSEGKVVQKKRQANLSPPNEKLGFEYDAAYYIILRHSSLRVDLGDDSFLLSPGIFRYIASPTFYYCDEITDAMRVRQNKTVKRHFLRETGQLIILPEPP